MLGSRTQYDDMSFGRTIARILLLPFTLTWFFAPSVLCGQKSATSQSAAPVIRVDSATASDWAELNRKVKTLENPSCNGGYRYFDQPTIVADLARAKVKAIRLVHFVNQRNPATRDGLRTMIRNVWIGKFQARFCQIAWAEGTFWSIEAVVEFEDGKESALITDGVHVALQDHEGKSWFFRLYLPPSSTCPIYRLGNRNARCSATVILSS
jgi:hypothetical protein